MPRPDTVGAGADLRIALVLGGGNALGAYHAGLYEVLQEADLEPDWIVGTSIGALTGAIIAGNEPERRVEQLRRFWCPADGGSGWPMPWDMIPDEWRRTVAVCQTVLGGRAGLFGPLGSLGAWPLSERRAGTPALYDTHMLSDTLRSLVDFDTLNGGGMRLTAVAIDVVTGDEVLIDTADRTVTPDHLRASAALLTAYPAVEVEGQLLGDGGLSMNLPLDPVLATSDGIPTLCIASDLLPLASKPPETIGGVVARMQDLIFAAQSRRTLSRWKAIYDAQPERSPSIALVNAAYTSQAREVAGKAMDFSPTSVRERWDAGRADGIQLAQRIRSGEILVGRPGLTIDGAEAG